MFFDFLEDEKESEGIDEVSVESLIILLWWCYGWESMDFYDD